MKGFRASVVRIGDEVYRGIGEVRYYFEGDKLVHVSGDTGKLMALVPSGYKANGDNIVFRFEAIGYLDWMFICVDPERMNLRFKITKTRDTLLDTFISIQKKEAKMSTLKKILALLREEYYEDL